MAMISASTLQETSE